MATAKLYLDTRKARTDGTYPLRVSIAHNSKTALVSLDIYLALHQWEKGKRGKLGEVVSHPMAQRLNLHIQQQFYEITRELLRLQEEKQLSRMTINEVRAAVIQALKPIDEGKHLFLDVYRDYMNSRKAQRTRELYKATLDRILEFDANADKLEFEDITTHWITAFNASLINRSPSTNARNIHLRNIRAVFNEALDSEYTQAYPFRKYKIKGVPTVKRSLSIVRVRTLFTYTPVRAHRAKYLDIFKLIFYLIGINLVDLCALRPENMVDGRINFYRAKTGRLYSIKVEQEAAEIIERYRGRDYLLNISDRYGNHHNYLKRLNSNLQDIAAELDLPPITSYWARHTWATLAAELDIPKDTIAAALGHGGRTVTDVYIDFDQRKVDEANRRIIDYINAKEPGD